MARRTLAGGTARQNRITDGPQDLCNETSNETIEREFLGGAAFQITTRNFTDARGDLCPIDFPILGFTPVRAFVINGVAGAVRGEHGHKRGRQLLMLISGEIEIELKQGENSETLRLDAENRLLLIEPGIWSRQKYLADNSSLMVFSDRPYDPDDYFHDEG